MASSSSWVYSRSTVLPREGMTAPEARYPHPAVTARSTAEVFDELFPTLDTDAIGRSSARSPPRVTPSTSDSVFISAASFFPMSADE